LLNSDNILHGGQEVEKEKHVPNEDLKDTRTSPTKAVALKDCYLNEDDVLPTNLASSLHD
jgi:hypothetical protein